MSNASPVLNGENTGGVADFSTEASVNMVAAIHDHISCAKPVPVDPFSSQDPKAGILTYPCEFDHMYASLSEGTVQKDGAEVKHLKELLLLHLDLIQQQSELIVTKDKQLAALRQENETLRQRLERMDRRVTLQKHREVSEVFVPSPVESVSAAPLLPPLTNSSLVISSPTAPVVEGDPNTISISLDSIDNSNNAPAETVVSNSDSSPVAPVEPPSSSRNTAWDITKRRRRQDSENTNTPVPASARRKRLHSWTSSVNSDSVSHDGRNSVTKEPLTEQKRVVKKPRTKAGAAKKDTAILLTPHSYFTIVGEQDAAWGATTEEKLSGHVEVPSWRSRTFTSCYTMEGTENLDDEVFSRRHQRQEYDEKRRKRWDVQRIREQRQVERLKQRQIAVAQRSRNSDTEEPLTTFWPQPEDAEQLEVDDQLPVAAFGHPIAKFTPSEFSLPWLSSLRPKTSSSHAGRRRGESKR